MRQLYGVVILCFWLSGEVLAQENRFSFTWNHKPLPEVFAELSVVSGQNFIFETSKLQHLKVSLTISNKTASEILGMLARYHRLNLRELPGGTIVISPAPPVKKITVSGQLSDSLSRQPIVQALLELQPGALHAISDTAGTFVFDEIKPGTYSLLVSHPSYRDSVFLLVAESKNLNVNVALRPKEIQKPLDSLPKPERPALFPDAFFALPENLVSQSPFVGTTVFRQPVHASTYVLNNSPATVNGLFPWETPFFSNGMPILTQMDAQAQLDLSPGNAVSISSFSEVHFFNRPDSSQKPSGYIQQNAGATTGKLVLPWSNRIRLSLSGGFLAPTQFQSKARQSALVDAMEYRIFDKQAGFDSLRIRRTEHFYDASLSVNITTNWTVKMRRLNDENRTDYTNFDLRPFRLQLNSYHPNNSYSGNQFVLDGKLANNIIVKTTYYDVKTAFTHEYGFHELSTGNELGNLAYTTRFAEKQLQQQVTVRPDERQLFNVAYALTWQEQLFERIYILNMQPDVTSFTAFRQTLDFEYKKAASANLQFEGFLRIATVDNQRLADPSLSIRYNDENRRGTYTFTINRGRTYTPASRFNLSTAIPRMEEYPLYEPAKRPVLDFTRNQIRLSGKWANLFSLDELETEFWLVHRPIAKENEYLDFNAIKQAVTSGFYVRGKKHFVEQNIILSGMIKNQSARVVRNPSDEFDITQPRWESTLMAEKQLNRWKMNGNFTYSRISTPNTSGYNQMQFVNNYVFNLAAYREHSFQMTHLRAGLQVNNLLNKYQFVYSKTIGPVQNEAPSLEPRTIVIGRSVALYVNLSF